VTSTASSQQPPTRSAWNPAQYGKFAEERAQPFYDLLAMVQPIPGGRAIDLGCGTGELTRVMHERVEAAETIGLDSSDTMLAGSAQHTSDSLWFLQGDIESFVDPAGFDLVFSNAALQWVDGHEALFGRLAGLVRPGGQLAVQMPANHDHLSHLIAHEVAAEEPFRSLLGGYVRTVPVESAEWYARALFRLGFREQSVRLQVYPHVLEGPGGVVEWVKGSLLTDYRKRLSPEAYDRYLARYQERLLPLLGEERPYFYAFKRLLLWGRR
jgi:trans-aconitate 2-methyltransferase